MQTLINTYSTINDLANSLASLLLGLTSNDEPIHIALSGGNTPKLLFKILNETYGKELANEHFHFWWGDERCVSPDHDESNYKWANILWLEPIGILRTKIHRIKGEVNPEDEAIRYSHEMRQFIKVRNGLPCFDLIILGLGDDGHTASIFPDSVHLFSSSKLCEVATHPITAQKRITITGKVLNNAQKIVFISTGSSKAEMVKKIAIDKQTEYPAAHINPSNGKIIWLLDNEAASLINSANYE